MKNIRKLTLCVIAALLIASCAQPDNSMPKVDSDIYSNLEFEMPEVKEPVIPDNTVNLVDFGAVSDGQTLNTQAFADAIDALTAKGGGKIIIPPGLWLTGPIHLKSNIEFYAEFGSIIKFSKDKDLYPIIETNFEGLNTYRCLSPIYGKNLEDIAFTGRGVWDGSGEAWRPVKRGKLTANQWRELVQSGGVTDKAERIWYPSEQYKHAVDNAELNVRKDLQTKEEFEAIRDFLRPVMVSIQNSKRVMFDGPTFQNSPAWCLHPLIVEDLIVRNTTVRNPWFSQNGDGLDVEACKNVLVINSNFDVGDDAICIKSGKDKDGRDQGVPCENLVIRDNIVYHGHGGVTVGSEMSGGVKNMHVSNCLFIGTDVGLRFKSRRGRGGVVENIFISDVVMTDIPTNAISFNLYYGGKSVSEQLASGGFETPSEAMPVTEETPQFKNISIKNVVIRGALQAVFLQGLPEMNLENIEIENLQARSQYGITMIDTDGVKISDVDITSDEARVIDIQNGKNILLDNIIINSKETSAVRISGSRCKEIELLSSPETDFNKVTIIDESVPEDAVKL